MSITLHEGDLPDGLDLGKSVAVDTEAMGLNNARDRLCVVQLSAGDGSAHIVQIKKGQTEAPNLTKLLSDPNVLKIFHYARFDIAIIKHSLGVECTPLYCTKIASTMARSFTQRHGLRDLCRDLLGVELNKQQQCSDWGAETLDDDQLNYAASDVLYLHRLKEKLDEILQREERYDLAYKVFECVMTRASLDLAGWQDIDIFAH